MGRAWQGVITTYEKEGKRERGILQMLRWRETRGKWCRGYIWQLWGRNVTARKPTATDHTLSSAFQMLISVSFGEVFSYLHSHSDTKLGGLVIWKEDAHTSRHFPQKWNKYADYWAKNVPFPQHTPSDKSCRCCTQKKDAILGIIPCLGLGIDDLVWTCS